MQVFVIVIFFRSNKFFIKREINTTVKKKYDNTMNQ